MDVRWSIDGCSQPLAPTDLAAALAGRAGQEGTLWVDLDHLDEGGMALLPQLFRVQSAEIAECHTRSAVPKVHLQPDHAFIAINGLVRGSDGLLHFQPLKTFISPTRLVTVLGPVNDIALTRDEARRDLTRLRARMDDGSYLPARAADLVATIRADVLRSHEDEIASLAQRVSQLERVVMRCDPVKAEHLLDEMFAMRHDLQRIRTNAAQTVELYARVAESAKAGAAAQGASWEQSADAVRLNDLRLGFEHLRNSADLEREYLQELLDLFEARVSTELNRFVRRLTAWGAIGLAGTLIAGIYGMNFANMPELEWQYGYPMALGAMVLVGVVLAAMFRRRGWM